MEQSECRSSHRCWNTTPLHIYHSLKLRNLLPKRMSDCLLWNDMILGLKTGLMEPAKHGTYTYTWTWLSKERSGRIETPLILSTYEILYPQSYLQRIRKWINYWEVRKMPLLDRKILRSPISVLNIYSVESPSNLFIRHTFSVLWID